MPLLCATATSNENETFPVAFSLIPGETGEAFQFFFQSLRENIFCYGVPEPGVVLTDKAAGMVKAVNEGCIPNSQFQLCSWHVAEAMLKHFRNRKYTSEEIHGTNEDQANGIAKKPGLKDLVWQYIESATLLDLESNRSALLEEMHADDKQYILDNWRHDEKLFIVAHTRRYPNLSAISTQRGESFHQVVHQVMNGS